MRPLVSLLAGLIFCATSAMAQSPLTPSVDGTEGLDIGTSTSEIAITSDFRGADLTIFGALTNPDTLLLAIGQYDVIVTLEGPRADATVRQKERIFGIWINRYSMTFERPPESYSLASTRPVEDIADQQVLNQLGVGLNHIPLTPVGYFSSTNSLGDFREAYRRLKQSGGLYQSETNGVRFVSSSLFKATLRLPANIPDGVHIVHAYLFKSGEFITQKELPLRVIKTGLEQTITEAAHQSPLGYGLFSVMLALITGWGASVLFRKD
ncbi:TIGR02186 family protein [Ciceribacter sp. L1K22]|uniref:TIGR02186 family protein n=1 Tax=Ciceribacter sp. L1K22 TaxID=2820275 RepID=UPI001ABE84DD|nr:TIGR02186 family protein [Ciceribacter sp. L1K22]MBO3758884.1 TIGR02186 family protein [Ciceribacter sp. L1K22]